MREGIPLGSEIERYETGRGRKFKSFPYKRKRYYPFPITNYQLPITNYQLPITNYPLPITNYQLPITNYPLPITHYPLPNSLFSSTASFLSVNGLTTLAMAWEINAFTNSSRLFNLNCCLTTSVIPPSPQS